MHIFPKKLAKKPLDIRTLLSTPSSTMKNNWPPNTALVKRSIKEIKLNKLSFEGKPQKGLSFMMNKLRHHEKL